MGWVIIKRSLRKIEKGSVVGISNPDPRGCFTTWAMGRDYASKKNEAGKGAKGRETAAWSERAPGSDATLIARTGKADWARCYTNASATRGEGQWMAEVKYYPDTFEREEEERHKFCCTGSQRGGKKPGKYRGVY